MGDRELYELKSAQAVTTEQIKNLTTETRQLTANVGKIGDSCIEMMKVQGTQAENIALLMSALRWTVALIVGAVLVAGLEFIFGGHVARAVVGG